MAASQNKLRSRISAKRKKISVKLGRAASALLPAHIRDIRPGAVVDSGVTRMEPRKDLVEVVPYVTGTDHGAYGWTPAAESLMEDVEVGRCGLRTKYFPESGQQVSVLGSPGEMPISLLLILLDGTSVAHHRLPTLASVLDIQANWPMRSFAGVAVMNHPLLVDARLAIASQYAKEMHQLLDISRLYTDALLGWLSPRASSAMGHQLESAALLHTDERMAFLQATTAFLDHLVGQAAKVLEKGRCLGAEGAPATVRLAYKPLVLVARQARVEFDFGAVWS